MGVISASNFLAPLTNKVHLGTIFIVLILFLTFRLSGGGLHTANYSQEESKETKVVVKTKQTKTTKPAVAKPAPKTEKDRGLDDIEAELGL